MPAVKLSDYDVRLSSSRWDRLAFRVEHALLSAGTSDMARLRGYLRVREWRQCASWRERAQALRSLVKLPARAWRDSWRATRVHGGHIARDHGVSRGRQLAQLWWIWVRHGMQPEVYYQYQLFRRGAWRTAHLYFQKAEASHVYRMLSARTHPELAELLLDKVAFEEWLVERGFPTVTTILEFEGGRVVRSRLDGGHLPRRDLFSKPRDSYGGRGAQRWRYCGSGWAGGADGRQRSEGELMQELAAQSQGDAVLVQEQLRNDPALAPLAPSALSTVRMLTLRDENGVVSLVLAAAKIPAGSAATDHLRSGGVAAPVELATGRLGRAVREDDTCVVAVCERHPDTGAVIEGFQLPHWRRAVELVLRAHEELGPIAIIGWDVALLEDGPVIVEGNDDPGGLSSQLPAGVPIGGTPVARAVATHMRRAFAGDGAGRAHRARPAPRGSGLQAPPRGDLPPGEAVPEREAAPEREAVPEREAAPER